MGSFTPNNLMSAIPYQQNYENGLTECPKEYENYNVNEKYYASQIQSHLSFRFTRLNLVRKSLQCKW